MRYKTKNILSYTYFVTLNNINILIFALIIIFKYFFILCKCFEFGSVT